MGVHIDGFDPFAADHDRQFLACRLLGVRAVQQTAVAEDNAGGDGSGTGFEKITACGHDNSSHGFCLPAWVATTTPD